MMIDFKTKEKIQEPNYYKNNYNYNNFGDEGLDETDFILLGYVSRKQYRERISNLKSRNSELTAELKSLKKKMDKVEKKFTKTLHKRTDKLEKKWRKKLDKQERSYKKKIDKLQDQVNDYKVRINNDPKFHIDLEKYRRMQEMETDYIKRIATLDKAIIKLKKQVSDYKAGKKKYKGRYKEYQKRVKKLEKSAKKREKSA